MLVGHIFHYNCMIYISFHIWSLRTSKCSLIFIKIRRMDCISLMKQSKLIVFESRRYPSSIHSSWLVELQDMVLQDACFTGALIYTFKENNSAADCFSNLGLHCNHFTYWQHHILLLIFKSFQSSIGSISLAASSLFLVLLFGTFSCSSARVSFLSANPSKLLLISSKD